MTSYTAMGASQQPNMTVSFKMDITTYGPHNGIFITSGIQQGTNGTAFAMAGQSSGTNIVTAAPSVPAITEVPAQRPASSLYGRDSPPDDFIKQEPIQINTFREQAPPTPVPYVQDPVDDLLLNDTTTTTTTVEVFRAKVDPNNPVDFFELPPNPNSTDPRPQLVRAAGLPYEVATRTDTRFSDRPTSGLGYVTPIPVYEPHDQLVHPSRISWIDANTSGPQGYQTTILRRNHNNQHEGRLLSRAGSRPGSPTYSIGPESVAGGRAYSTAERYTPAPAPLRYTYSQPDIYTASTGGRENYYRHRYNGRRSKSPNPYYEGRRSQSPAAYYDGRRSRSPARYYDGELPPMSDLLRRTRSRSETRLDQLDRYSRPTSALSNESYTNSVNNVFKLYETRDCLGNIIAQVDPGATSARTQSSTESLMADTSPRKEVRRYDREMTAKKTPEPILRSKAATSNERRVGFAREPPVLRKSRSRSRSKSPKKAATSTSAAIPSTPIETDTPRSTSSGPTGFASRELAPEAPLCVPEVDDATPRTQRSVSAETVVFPPPPPRYTKLDENPPPPPYLYSAPTCLEAHDSVEPVKKTRAVSQERQNPEKLESMTVDRVKLSESASEQLARHGYISPRKRVTKFTEGRSQPNRSNSTDRTVFAIVEPTYIPSKEEKPVGPKRGRSTSVDASPMTRLNYDIGVPGTSDKEHDDSWLPPPPSYLIPKEIPSSLRPRSTATESVVRNVPIATHLSEQAPPIDVPRTRIPGNGNGAAPPAYKKKHTPLSKSVDNVSIPKTPPEKGIAREVNPKLSLAKNLVSETFPKMVSTSVSTESLPQKVSMPPMSSQLHQPPFKHAQNTVTTKSITPTLAPNATNVDPTTKTLPTALPPPFDSLPDIPSLFRYPSTTTSPTSSKATYQLPPLEKTLPKQPNNLSKIFQHTSPSEFSTTSSMSDAPPLPVSNPSQITLNVFKSQSTLPTPTTMPSKPFYTIVPPTAPVHGTQSPTSVIPNLFQRQPESRSKTISTTAPLTTQSSTTSKPTFNSNLRASFTRKKPPLPPKRTTSMIDTTPRLSPSDSDIPDVPWDSMPQPVFEQRNPIDPNVRVVAENSKLHFFGFLP